MRTCAIEQFIVFLPVRLEIKAEVKNGFTDRACDTQQERNQQAAQSSVSVQEGVNSFKLHMCECGLDQNRQVFVVAMQELFEPAHAFHHFLRWWRDKCCVTGPRASDPVLCFAEFPRTLLTASSFGQENLVNFSYQPQRERKILAEPAKAVIHRGHII